MHVLEQSVLILVSYTVAIVGNGLDICYPAEHERLMERIRENGITAVRVSTGNRAVQLYISAAK